MWFGQHLSVLPCILGQMLSEPLLKINTKIIRKYFSEIIHLGHHEMLIQLQHFLLTIYIKYFIRYISGKTVKNVIKKILLHVFEKLLKNNLIEKIIF